MKKIVLLFLALPFLVGFSSGMNHGGYFNFTFPDGLVAYYGSSPRGHNSDASVWEDLTEQFSKSALDMSQPTAGNQPVISSTGRAFTTNDFVFLDEIDDEQGAMTFIADGGSAEFRDAGQDFSDWETAPSVGLAAYRITITTDNGTSYGYMGASNNAGADIDIYSDYALTTRGWKGRTTPQATPDTAASYEIYKTIGTTNLTGDQTHIVVLKPDDGQPAAAKILFSRDSNVAGTVSMYAALETTGKVTLYASEDGTNYESITTNAAVFSNGAQTVFTNLIFVLDKTNATGAIYVDGVAVATTETISTGALFDTHAPLMIGAYGTTPAGFLEGDFGKMQAYEAALTAAEAEYIYDAFKMSGVH